MRFHEHMPPLSLNQICAGISPIPLVMGEGWNSALLLAEINPERAGHPF